MVSDQLGPKIDGGFCDCIREDGRLTVLQVGGRDLTPGEGEWFVDEALGLSTAIPDPHLCSM